MKICHIKPSSSVSDYIAGYATVTIDNKNDFPFNGSALPDGFVELYFSKYGSLSLKSSGQYESNNLHTGFLIGQSNKKIKMLPNEALEFFQVKIFPWAAKYFLTEKASLYSNKVIFICELGDSKLMKLQDKMLHARTTVERIKIVELFVLENIRLKSDFSCLLKLACIHIFYANGVIRIKKLANDLNVSTQYLERLFKEHIGLSPKKFCSTVRMRSLVSFQNKYPSVSLTQLAHQFNYFDQSHFIHDFHNFMDETPKSFFKKDDNFVFDFSPFNH